MRSSPVMSSCSGLGVALTLSLSLSLTLSNPDQGSQPYAHALTLSLTLSNPDQGSNTRARRTRRGAMVVGAKLLEEEAPVPG